ncbi:MAG: B12-binding domain-containing radical SAM protein, partial [Clostridia bacterium]
MNNFEDRLNKILLEVEKPARYTGGEWNTPNMTKPARAKFCFCFPDIYEIGMSNLGVQILYDVINREPDFVAERCFAPWTDMGEKLKENDIPLLSLETKTPLKDFDVVGFSVGFELLYTNILYMLELSHIPFFAKERDDSFPLIVAGG